MSTTETDLSIGQVAERTGLSVHTLRLYEREGLFTTAVRRSSSGRRVYSRWDVDWLGTCLLLRASGMPLATIRRFAELVREGEGNEPERLVLLRRHEQYIHERLSELNECLSLITTKVAGYEQHLAAGTAGTIWNPPPLSDG